MSGQVPEWLFAVCLLLAVVAGFAGGYAWAGAVRHVRRERELARLRRRFEAAAREPPVLLLLPDAGKVSTGSAGQREFTE